MLTHCFHKDRINSGKEIPDMKASVTMMMMDMMMSMMMCAPFDAEYPM